MSKVNFRHCLILSGNMDNIYEFIRADTVASQHVARLAVMYPLVSQKNEKPIEKLDKLLTVWRTRVSELHDNGWLSEYPVGFQYARNCPPNMAIYKNLGKSARHCHHYSICPWCYSRKVAELYGCLETIQYNDKKLYSIAGSCLEATCADLRSMVSHHFIKLQSLIRANDNRAICSAWTLTCEPAIGESKVKFVYRLISVMPRTESFHWVPNDKHWKVLELTEPKLEDVQKAVVHFYRYPKGMIYGDARLAFELLKAKEGFRLRETSGILRGIKSNKDCNKDTGKIKLELNALMAGADPATLVNQ